MGNRVDLNGSDRSKTTVRRCEIPGEKAIFFPVITVAYFAWLNDPSGTRNPGYAREILPSICDITDLDTISVTIDGVPVVDPESYITTADQSPVFQVQLPTDNVFDYTEENVNELVMISGVHNGVYIFLEPLKKGTHTIKWKADGACGYQDIQYNLTVKK